jgi:hypothetical protein
MRYKYYWHCKKCGFYIECPTKLDLKIEKKDHKDRGCNFELAPYEEDFILVRSSLAKELKDERDLLVKKYAEEEEKQIENSISSKEST